MACKDSFEVTEKVRSLLSPLESRPSKELSLKHHMGSSSRVRHRTQRAVGTKKRPGDSQAVGARYSS
jgi:hypothetical protein